MLGYQSVSEPSIALGVLLPSLVTTTVGLSIVNLARLRAEESLQNHRHALELRVGERTRALRVEVEERRAAELAAQEANQAKGRFLANMSHELRTPLNAMRGYTEMVRDDLAERGDEVLAGDLDKALSAGDRLLQMVSDVLDLARIDADRLEIPADMTFVDKNDKVKYFTQGKERIFARNRAIINRDVRLCHPPGSTHIIERILDDFKSGKASHAPFWIQMKGKFIKIEYFALRDENNEYLGTLEVSQDLTENRKLEGEKRILSYSNEKE